MHYAAQLHAGHWYVCTYTWASHIGIALPRDLDRAYNTQETQP